MCGLAGLFDSRGAREIDRQLLRRMNDRLSHRGPDGSGDYCRPGIGLAHRRLAIIDLAGGAQPLFNEDGSVVVVFNGEIYNFQELADLLTATGHTLRTRSDTEVIVHAWEQWGPDCVRRFHGMFAFALWDANAETLLLARDRLGKKPLYWTELADGMVLFGSELKALTLHPGLERRLDPQAVEDYLALGYVPDPRSIWQGVSKLPPAHTLTWRRGRRPLLARYWRPQAGGTRPRTLEQAQGELMERLRAAVRQRLVADVPLGAFLSGGLDSSAVVAVMAGESSRPVESFSIAIDHPAYDESGHAAKVAERYRTNHRVRRVDPSAIDLVDRLAAIHDEPFGDSSSMPTLRLCAAARERVTVALSGDGGDELFAGYRRTLWHCREERLRSLMPDWLRRPVFGLAGQLYPKLDWAPRPLRARTVLRELALDPAEAYFGSVAAIGDDPRLGLYSQDFRRRLNGYRASELIRAHMAEADSDDPLWQAQYADLMTWLPGDILVKVDRASMAVGLEVRGPLLDHRLVEWSAGLPSDFKLWRGIGKRVLKGALAAHLPAELIARPKQGFSVPLAQWFRGPLRERVRAALTGPVLADTGLFEPAALAALVERHQSGRRDHGVALWVLLMFESFLRLATEPRPAERPAMV